MTAWPSQHDNKNGMMEGRAPASPRRCQPGEGAGGPPPSNPNPFCQYFLRRC